MIARRNKHIPRSRVISAIVAIVLLGLGALLRILNTERTIAGNWSSILPVLFVLAGVIFALLAWLFPFSPDYSATPRLPLVRKLVPESFQMGDTAAANFPYLTSTILDTFNAATQALHDASARASSKRGILILGEANAGKTRLAFETMRKTLPNWSVLRWRPDYTIDTIQEGKPSRKKGLVIFVDDLQEYVLTEIHSSDESNITAILHTLTPVPSLRRCFKISHLLYSWRPVGLRTKSKRELH